MPKRLQVLLDEDELAEIQRLARRRHLTTAAWVREALRLAREQERPDVERKLRAVRDAMAHAYPTGSIEELLTETEAGYRGPDPE